MVVGRARKKGWVTFYKQTLGFVPGPHPALMGLYVPYCNDKPWTKFERIVHSGITYHDAEYSHKVSSGAGADVSHLKECAHCISQEIDDSVKAAGEEQLAAAEHASELCATHDASQYVMGLHGNPANQVHSAPFLCDLADDGRPILTLEPCPSFQSGNHGVCFVFDGILY